MNLREVIQKTVRASGRGTDTVGNVNAAVTASVNEPGPSRTHVSSRQRIVQRGGRTDVTEEHDVRGDG